MTPQKSQRGRSTVLFVDDEPRWLDAIKLAVQGATFDVVTADGGESALKALKRYKPDLILSDVRMPFMNGFDLYERVRSDPALKTIPYVFMSSIDDFDAKNTAHQLGADGYVQKPFDSDGVQKTILELLARFQKK
jgi:CheY-like chemotaxis protein